MMRLNHPTKILILNLHLTPPEVEISNLFIEIYKAVSY